MLEQILTSLSNGLDRSLGWALLAAFAWGVVSIVFSPCHLASVPLVVGFISTQEDASTRRAFRLSLLFALGVLASIAVIGVVTWSCSAGCWATSGLSGTSRSPPLSSSSACTSWACCRCAGTSFPRQRAGGGLRLAVGLGLAFGVGLGPCSFAFLAPLLMIVFGSATTDYLLAVGLLAAFAAGHCGVIVAAGTAAQHGCRSRLWGDRSGVTVWVRRISGALVVLAGVYLLVR